MIWNQEINKQKKLREVNIKKFKLEKNILNLDILFLVLDNSAYLFVLNWREKLIQKEYSAICNLEVKKFKNALKNISYFSPKLVIIIGKKELETGKILTKDCQKKQEFMVDKERLVSQIHGYLSKER